MANDCGIALGAKPTTALVELVGKLAGACAYADTTIAESEPGEIPGRLRTGQLAGDRNALRLTTRDVATVILAERHVDAVAAVGSSPRYAGCRRPSCSTSRSSPTSTPQMRAWGPRPGLPSRRSTTRGSCR